MAFFRKTEPKLTEYAKGGIILAINCPTGSPPPMAEPSVRDCMGRTVRVDDWVTVLSTGSPISQSAPGSDCITPLIGEQYPIEEVRPEDGCAIISQSGTIDGREFDGLFALSSDDMELAACLPDACDLIIEEKDLIKKAERGEAGAQYTLGKLYEPLYWRTEAENQLTESQGIARKWFELAARQGHRDAQFAFGGYFDWENPDEAPTALKWIQSAAEQGHAEACMALSDYFLEYGSDEAEALRWYRLGRELGHPHDPTRLGILSPIFSGGLPPRNFIERLRKAANRSDKHAQHTLGTLYATGTWGMTESMADAYAWFAIAAGYDPKNSDETILEEEVLYGGWGTPERAIRLLTPVLSDAELERAREIYRECVTRIQENQQSVGIWRRLAQRLVDALKAR